MSNEDTYSNLKGAQKEAAVRKEMLPFFVYTAIPILITLMIAYVFGPSL